MRMSCVLARVPGRMGFWHGVYRSDGIFRNGKNADMTLREAIIRHIEDYSRHPRYDFLVRGIAARESNSIAVNVVDKAIDKMIQQLKREGLIQWDRSRKKWILC